MRSPYRISLQFALFVFCIVYTSPAQWTKITPFGTTVDFLSIAAIPNGSSGTYLFAGGLGTGVTLSGNNGASWTSKNTGLGSSNLQALAASGTTLYAGTLTAGAYYSTDNGTSWTQVKSGLPRQPYDTSICFPVVAFGFSGSNVFAGTEYWGNIYRLNSTKTAWENAGNIISNWVTNFFPVSSSELLAATCSGVVGSSDNGQTWSSYSSGMGKDSIVQSVAVVPNGSGGTTMLAGISLANGSADGGILTSTNGGTSWTQADSGMVIFFTDVVNYYWSVTALAVTGTNVFAATNGGGLYFSTDQGKFWTRVDQGLNDSTFNALFIYHDTLYAGGLYGVYKRPVSQFLTAVKESKTEIPAEFSLSQNYPNPFNPSTLIRFSVPTNGRAMLKIFNVLGQEAATLFNGDAIAGVYHEATFNASGLPSGIYFSRLDFGGRAQVKKMLLLK